MNIILSNEYINRNKNYFYYFKTLLKLRIYKSQKQYIFIIWNKLQVNNKMKKIRKIKMINPKKKINEKIEQLIQGNTNSLNPIFKKFSNEIKEENHNINNNTLKKGNEIDTKNNINEIYFSNDIIKIKTTDGKLYEVPYDILKQSTLLEYSNESNDIVLLNEVDSVNFDKVLEYLNHYKNRLPKEIPKPFPERTDDEFFRSILEDDWTFNFLQNLSIEGAINLVNCANYLQLDGLINLLAAKLAHEMCNCEVEEARKKFGIECDMTEEEVAEYDKYPLD